MNIEILMPDFIGALGFFHIFFMDLALLVQLFRPHFQRLWIRPKMGGVIRLCRSQYGACAMWL